jgi:tetratricopeptide (TPR) repeat protein
MGDVIWRQEMQTAALKDILRTLQAPLDTASRELRARGEDAYRNGWYQEALSDFLESEQKNYQDFAVHRFIGNIYLYHIVDLPRASEYFRKAAKYARPRDCKQAAEAEFFAGIAFGLQKVYDAALKHMLEVVSLNATFYEAHYMAASFAALLGDAPAACEFAQKAIRGDIRYYERFKHDRCFDKMRSELGMLEELKAQERLTDSLVATFESTLEHLRYQCQDVRSLWAAGAAPYDLSCQLEEVKKLRRQADYVALRVAASKICEALSLPPSCAVPALHQETESTWNSQTQSPKVLAQRLIESWTLGRIGPSHNMPR